MTLELTLINGVTMPVLGLGVYQSTPDVLDRVDELVAPGATINPDAMHGNWRFRRCIRGRGIARANLLAVGVAAAERLVRMSAH